jgi:hypothetical protein
MYRMAFSVCIKMLSLDRGPADSTDLMTNRFRDGDQWNLKLHFFYNLTFFHFENAIEV